MPKVFIMIIFFLETYTYAELICENISRYYIDTICSFIFVLQMNSSSYIPLLYF